MPSSSNLASINSAFQSKCWEIIQHITTPSLILCDFPSEIIHPDSRFKIYGLDDYSHFLSSCLSHEDTLIILLTQQHSILAKIFNTIHVIPRPFQFFFRVPSSLATELKFIELFNALPFDAWQKITALQSISSFKTTISGKKGPLLKNFDVFQLIMLSSHHSPSLQAPIIPPTITGIVHSPDYELFEQVSTSLASIAIPFTQSNDLNANLEPLTHHLTVHFTPPSIRDSLQHLLDSLYNAINPADHFVFAAIASCYCELPSLSPISFISTKKVDIHPLLPLFSSFSIPHISTTIGLIFVASLEIIEELILAAPQANIAIPAQFLNNLQSISFSHDCNNLIVTVQPLTIPSFSNLQIVRLSPGCPNSIYFSPDFLEFITQRFFSRGAAQLQTIRDSAGRILEVLAFSSRAQLQTDTPDLVLPLPFEFDDFQFLLTHLEPLFTPKKKTIFEYPFESSQEHFSRFENVSDTLASRIPLIYPHTDKGGPNANNIISSIVSSITPATPYPISTLTCRSSPSFHIQLSPFPTDWQQSVLSVLNTQMDISACPLQDFLLHTPSFIILDIPPRYEFHIPFYIASSMTLAKCGWVSVRSFSKVKLILEVISPHHNKLLIAYLISLHLPNSCNTYLCLITPDSTTPPTPLPLNADLLELHTPPASETPEQDEDMLPTQQPPLTPPPHAAALLVTYRLLAYLTWPNEFDHPRQRLLEAIAGGLHLRALDALGPYLTAALDDFPEDFFTSVQPIAVFNLITEDFHPSISSTLFSSLHSDTSTDPVLSPIIPLPHLPPATTEQELTHAFSNIFNYLPSDTHLKIGHTTFIFSSPQSSVIHLTDIFPLMGTSFTISAPAKLRTSDHNRNMTLKLHAVYLEISANTLVTTDSYYLLIEKYHPNSNTVTVYDPILGSHIKQVTSLVLYKPLLLIFKRGSQPSLICPKLLQRFALTSPSLSIPSTSSKFCIISLFDGSGSFTNVISDAVGHWPCAILAAEMDAGTRAVVSKVKGWSVEGSLWTYDKNNAHTFYTENVWSIIDKHCLLLRQFLSLLPKDCTIFFGAGSPCPDLTIIGRGNGVLGLTGNRSVHIHCVWAVLYFLSKTSHWKRVVILVENAGSMKPHMKQYIHDLLGIPDKCAHYLNCAHWGPVSRARYFFTSSTIKVVPPPTSSPFDDGWSPALIISPDKENHLQPRPLPPWLRPRLVTDKGSVVQSPLAYHPNNLLYDINFFVSRSNFELAHVNNLPALYPSLPFKDFLPAFLWEDWDSLVNWGATFESVLTPAITNAVSHLQDFYDNPHIYLPFRLPTLHEKAKDSELSDLIYATISEANPPLRTLHNIIGNFFKPSAVLAALGGPDSIRKFVYGGQAPNEWAPKPPTAVELQFTLLRERVLSDTIQNPELRSFMAERWFPKNSPPLDKDDFWHSSLHTPPTLVVTAASPSAPSATPAPSSQLPSPYSPAILHTLESFPPLNLLAQHAVSTLYPTSMLFTDPIPPFKSTATPFLLSSSLLLRAPFLLAYFKGWEIFQPSTAAIVLREESGVVTHFAFGALQNYYRLYLFVFDGLQEHFRFSLLLQGTTPPPTLLPLLRGLHAEWNLTDHVAMFKPLLSQFPRLIVFSNVDSLQQNSFALFLPWGLSLFPITWDPTSLLPTFYSLFETSSDAPMWGPASLPALTGTYPFQVHLQMWLFIHLAYLQHYSLPLTPFVILNCFAPAQQVVAPDLLFCAQNSPPSPDMIAATQCPNLFIPEHITDQMCSHYGLIIAQPNSIYPDLRVADLEPMQIPYP